MEPVTAVAPESLVRVASLAELRSAGRLVVHVDRHTICLFADGDGGRAVDNRGPPLGFPPPPPPRGLPAPPGGGLRRDPPVSLASRPLRPRHRRHVRSVRGRASPLPG